jgi:hypothetical protein
MNTPQTVALVPLDPWDELLYSISTEYAGTGSGAAVLHVRGVIEEAPLRAALASLQQRHPKLRARIVESADRRHAFEITRGYKPIPFELRDVATADLPWREESSRLLGASLDPAVDPLVHVVVLRAPARDRCILVLMAHHSVGDGHSVLRLVDDLLGYYAAAERGGAASPTESLRVATAPRALPSGPVWRRLLQSAALYRRRRDNRKADWTWLPEAPGGSPHRLWGHFVLTAQETAALALRCRREKAALYGALYAAAARGLIVALQRPQARFKCRFPIDIRRQLAGASGPVTDHDLGNFVSGYEAIYDVDGRSTFWMLARRARHDLERFTAAGGPSLVYNFIRFIRLPYVPPTPRRGTILVNSYGVVDLRERYGSLGLEELSIVFNNVTAGPSLLIQGFVIQRRLNVSLSMADVPEDFWERVRNAIQHEFQEAIDGERNDQRAIRA